MQRIDFSESRRANIDEVALPAAVAFGFVYIHPFLDGNGRLHRFLIHHVLAQKKFTPPGVILPVSAAILRRQNQGKLAQGKRKLFEILTDAELAEIENRLSGIINDPDSCSLERPNYRTKPDCRTANGTTASSNPFALAARVQ
jgi:Fic family protein